MMDKRSTPIIQGLPIIFIGPLSIRVYAAVDNNQRPAAVIN